MLEKTRLVLPRLAVMLGSTFTSVLSMMWFGAGRLNHLSERLSGSTVSDSGFLAGRFASLRSAELSPLSPSVLSNIGWPTGVVNRAHINWTAPLSVTSNFVLFEWAGPTASQIAFAMAGVILTATIVGLVATSVSESVVAGLLAAFLVTISSPMLHWAQEAPNYTYIGLLVLFWYCLLDAILSDAPRKAHLAGISGLTATLWLQYFGLFVWLILVFTTLAHVSKSRYKVGRTIRVVVPYLLVALVPYVFVYLNHPDSIPRRDSEESAVRHLSLERILSHASYFYLGWALLATALTLMVVTQYTRRKRPMRTQECSVISSICLMFVGFFIALGPQRAGLIPLPSQIIPHLVPQFRHGIYSAHLLQALMSVLVALLCAAAVQRRLFRVVLVVVVALAAAADGFRQDMSGGDRLLQLVVTPPAVQVLSQYPKGPIANFPWEMSSEFGSNADATPCLRQAVTGMPLVNTCDYDEPPTPLIRQVQSVETCEKLRVLRDAGVKYMIVDFSSMQPQLMRCLSDAPYALPISSSGDVTVWGLADWG